MRKDVDFNPVRLLALRIVGIAVTCAAECGGLSLGFLENLLKGFKFDSLYICSSKKKTIKISAKLRGKSGSHSSRLDPATAAVERNDDSCLNKYTKFVLHRNFFFE
jgi:hypothetical protein